MSFDSPVTESCAQSILGEPQQSINEIEEIIDNGSYGGVNQNHHYSNTSQVVEWLTGQGLAALPVAPAQDPEKYFRKKQDGTPDRDKQGNKTPLFTGKNPSYLDRYGIPHIISHKTYQKRLPTPSEIALWWANPLNGVGGLGTDLIRWVDIDVKNFESQEDCDRQFDDLLQRCPELKTAPIQKTHSGGYRVGIKLVKPMAGTNIALQKDGPHIGELLGAGRFAVLAPTIGPSGNPYRVINHSLTFPEIDVDGVLFPVKKDDSKQKGIIKNYKPIYTTPVSGSVSLIDCLCPKAKAIFDNPISGEGVDRSLELTTLVKEVYGWANWLKANLISYTDDPLIIAHRVGDGMGLDSGKIDRIIVSCSPESCFPSAHYRSGDEACQKKVNKLLGIKTRPQKPPKPKGYGSIKRYGQKIKTNRVDYAISIIYQANETGDKPQLLYDNSPTGSGKSHDNVTEAPKKWKQKYSNGRTIYCSKNSRNLTIKDDGYTLLPPRNDFGFCWENDKLVRADESTPLSEVINLGGKCTRTEQFKTLANKGLDPYQIGSKPIPCQSCPDEKKCRFTEGWFRKDRRDILDSGDDLKCHPSSLLGVDLSDYPTLLILDEFTSTLSGHSVVKGSIETLQSEINEYADLIEASDQDCDTTTMLGNAMAIVRELNKLGQSEAGLSRHGLDDQNIFFKALKGHSEQANEVLNVVSNLMPNLYPDFEGKKTTSRVERIELEEQILSKLSARHSPLLVPLLRFVAGDRHTALHIKDSRVSITQFNPRRYDDFLSAKGIIAIDATGDLDSLQKLFPDSPITPFWKGEDKPQSNLNIHILETKGIAGRYERSDRFLGLYGRVIEGIETRHGVKPVQFSLKCDRDVLGTDGHWGNETRGSNQYAGYPVAVASGMPCPNLTSKRLEYAAMGGKDGNFEEWYAREINREILQATGRHRCHRYPGQTFDFYLIVPPGYDWEFLEWEGAKVTQTSIQEIEKLASESLFNRIFAACKKLVSEGVYPSQRAIAEAIGSSQKTVGRFLLTPESKPINKYIKESDSLVNKTQNPCPDWFTTLDVVLENLLMGGQKITLRSVGAAVGISHVSIKKRLDREGVTLDQLVAQCIDGLAPVDPIPEPQQPPPIPEPQTPTEDPFNGFVMGQHVLLWSRGKGDWIPSEIVGVTHGWNGFLKIQYSNGIGGDFMFDRSKLDAGLLAIAQAS